MFLFASQLHRGSSPQPQPARLTRTNLLAFQMLGLMESVYEHECRAIELYEELKQLAGGLRCCEDCPGVLTHEDIVFDHKAAPVCNDRT